MTRSASTTSEWSGSSASIPAGSARRTANLGLFHRLEALFDRGQLAPGVAGVDRPGRLDQEKFQTVACARAMRDSLRHDEQLTGAELNVAVPHLDDQPALEDQEELVGISVLVPHELTVGLGDLDVVVIEAGDDLWAPE